MSRRLTTALALAICALFAIIGAASVNMDLSMGWDEAMHAGWPAARMATAIGSGDVSGLLTAIHDCQQYPFVGPLWTALVWTVTGIDEASGRGAARLLWAIGLFGIYLLAREAAEGRRGERSAPWIALAFAGASPLALAFSGTLFLEVPSTVIAIFALRAWLRRRPGRRDLAAGAWMALLFFTKFNYAMVIGAGLFVDLLVDGILAGRRGEAGPFMRRVLSLAAVPVLTWLWWFGLPLPQGFARAAAHREAFLDWISGNTEFAPTPRSLRLLHWGVFLVWAPRVLLLMAIGIGASLVRGPRTGARRLAIVGAVSITIVSSHPFHLDRFLMPLAPALWVLAGVGWAQLLPRAKAGAGVVLAGLAAAAFLFPSADAWWLMDQVGMRNEEVFDYQAKVLRDLRDLHPRRPLFTNGLNRVEFDLLVDLVDQEWDEPLSMGWCGVSPTFSPGAILIELHSRGVDVSRALQRRDLDRTFVDLAEADPGWETGRLLEWARGYERLFASRPIDLSGSKRRDWLERYQIALVESGEWSYAQVGSVFLQRLNGPKERVDLLVLRRQYN